MTSIQHNNFINQDTNILHGDQNDENGGDTENLRQIDFHHTKAAESPLCTPNQQRGENYIVSHFQYQQYYTFMENQLIESVKASINNEIFENATFLCERLHAQVQNEDVKHLLA